ncbi:MAG: hypothetical protein RLZZ453_744 [Chlamydiota bacterium]
MILLPFLFLALAFVSVWIKKKPIVWGSLCLLSVGTAYIQHLFSPLALLTLGAFILLWIWYYHSSTFLPFLALTCFGIAFKLHLVPCSEHLMITPAFSLNLSSALIGLFPLALCVPLVRHMKELPSLLFGLLIGCAGIALLAAVAIFTGAVHFQYKMASFLALRSANNLLLVAIPEEAFFRGFLQKKLSSYMNPIASLFITSALFTLTHVYWSPSLDILAFVFLASLLYGATYMISKRIESAILVHFLLNFIHWTFFSYHTM